MSEVRQLTKNQELVESIYTETAYQFQTDSQSHAAHVVHRFIEAQAACISQRAIGTPELVFNNITRIAQQDSSRFFFALDTWLTTRTRESSNSASDPPRVG